MIKYWPGEKEDIDRVLEAGDRWGYGNLISHLKRAWSERLMKKWNHDQDSADLAAGIICPWCKTDKRTGKVKGEDHK